MNIDIVFNPVTHKYFYEGKNVLGVNEILELCGLRDVSNIPVAKLMAGADRGHAVHTACELWDRADWDNIRLDAPLLPFLEAWKQFRADTSVSLIEIEKMVFSRAWGYAGRLDRIGLFPDGRRAVIDIKTSATLSPATALQLAGYQIAYQDMFPKEKISSRIAVRLGRDGRYKMTEYKTEQDINVYKSCVIIAQWKKQNLKEIK
jgi:hypothetical protein